MISRNAIVTQQWKRLTVRLIVCYSDTGKVGKELPCYVHDRERDTALQCLMTDEEKPSCDAKHPATSRLCVCVGGMEQIRAVHQQQSLDKS